MPDLSEGFEASVVQKSGKGIAPLLPTSARDRPDSVWAVPSSQRQAKGELADVDTNAVLRRLPGHQRTAHLAGPEAGVCRRLRRPEAPAVLGLYPPGVGAGGVAEDPRGRRSEVRRASQLPYRNALPFERPELWIYRSSLCRVASVDDEFGAGDELCLVGGQVDRAPGDVVRFAHVA
jgi:hypothetical protein